MATKKSAPAKKAAPSKSSGTRSAASKSSTPNKGAATKQASKKANGPSKSEVATGLRELFIDELKDIYWAEKALTKALPKMAKKATSEDLVDALESHLEETLGQVERLDQVFSALDEKAQAKKCEAMDGLIKESQEIMESTESGPVRDAGIISAAQKVEHYEIASYGTLVQFARTLGEDEAADLLEETLNEEKEADSKLTEIAVDSINLDAMEEDDDEDEDDDSEDDDEMDEEDN